MKRARISSSNNRTRKVACTVSAAALMLGVSQAATVGLYFRVNYCADPTYTAAPVSMTAFGIGTNAWENLTQMDTGYSCSSGSGPYTLSQVVDTTTSTGGLNPLPNGSLSITWSADTANFSGFAGYGGTYPGYSYAGPPSYSYGGGAGGDGHPPPYRTPPQPYPTGEWEVYNSFLRDGVNFGPQSGNGYSIDINGLKTLFTNTPYAVQLVASSDSMQYLTNAFIIDVTGNTTQSVVYPSTPPVADVGDTTWIRGHGGGLSTASGSLNTTHLKIMGNQAAHGGDKVTGYNFASTISAAIITDKPVVTMSPQQVLVCGGDNVTWSGYAVGVPPLTYQWRKNGVAIAGATTTFYNLAHVTLANVGTYDLLVTNLYGSAVSASVVVGDKISTPLIGNLVLDSNPKGPQHNGLNNGATWLASSTDGGSVTRTGVMSFSTNAPSQITVVGETNFNTPTGTIMFWMRSRGVADPTGNPATLFDRLSGTGSGSGLVVVQNTDGTVTFQAGSGATFVGILNSVATPGGDNRWHQVAVVYDQSGNTPCIFYVDGQPDSGGTASIGPWSWPSPSPELELGLSHNTNSWQAYNGLMDDVRCYNRVLTPTEITSAYSGALVDTNALVMQLNFTAAPGSGINLTWQCPDAILQSASSVNGPYTDVPGAVSPYSVSVQSAAQFYRYRGHTPVVIVANPYLM
jgi:hypothetical protein